MSRKQFRVRTPEEQERWLADEAARQEKACSTLSALLDALEAGEPLPELAPDPEDEDRDENGDDEGDAAVELPPGTLPVRRADLSGTGWTPARQRAFIAYLADQGCVSQACAAVGLSKQSAYALRRRGGRTMFAFAWDVAIRTARKRLLDEATERALAGREVPVWYRGEEVGTRIVHNDRMLMFLLALKPEPLHPDHDDAALRSMWPMMLDLIDTELPLSSDPTALLHRDGCRNGNDRPRS